MLAIKAAIPTGGSVALPAWGCYDLATAAAGADARVVLYDVEPATLAPNFESLQRALADGARAVVVAHFYGVPVDMDAVTQSAAAVGAIVIEDAAQAIGATWRGRPAGTAGALGVLSFGRGKGLNGGGGGALLINDVAAPTVDLDSGAGFSELTRASAQWLLARPALYALPASLPFLRLGDTVYHDPRPPRGLSRASARMLLANWEDAHAATMARRRNAERLRVAAVAAGWSTIRVPEGGEAGYLRMPMLGSASNRGARVASGARLGIMPGYPQTLLSLPGFRGYCSNASEAFPGADELAEKLLTLPTHALLTEADLRRIDAWLVGS
jgi:perosamine synthetase